MREIPPSNLGLSKLNILFSENTLKTETFRILQVADFWVFSE